MTLGELAQQLDNEAQMMTQASSGGYYPATSAEIIALIVDPENPSRYIPAEDPEAPGVVFAVKLD